MRALALRSLSRLQAAGLHLAASVVATCMVAVVTLLVWYPGELAKLGGVLRILLLLVAVDVVLGPVITFIVFNTKKPELARDLMIVALVQVAALAYGTYTVFAGRPVYLVFNSEQLDLVYAPDIAPSNLERGRKAGFATLPKLGPEVVVAVMPTDPAEAARIVAQAVAGGDDIQYLPEHFRPLPSERARVITALKPLDGLKAFNKQSSDEVDALRKRFADHAGGVGYLPLKAGGEAAVAVMDRQTGELLALRRLNPGK